MVVLPRGTSPTVVATIDPQGKIQKGGGILTNYFQMIFLLTRRYAHDHTGADPGIEEGRGRS